ncbi:SF3B2 [Scenedesmus sp. PABB004]|nr:SF3B2 [Scenedesmus sp. PABB004]
MATDEAQAAAPANGHADGAGPKRSKAEKKKERRQKNKQSKQQRRQQSQQQQEAKPPPASAEEDDVVIEYVPAPAPDIEGLLAAAPGKKPAGDAAAAAGDGGEQQQQQDGEEADEEERGGLGLGARAGLGAAPAAEEGEDDADAVDADDVMAQFKRVLERFMPADEAAEEGAEGAEGAAGEAGAGPAKSDADSDEEGEDGEGGSKLSRKQRKLLHRLKIAELKQQCARPDVVEVWDVTAPDPQTLVTLKALRNTVSVPQHWSQKRKYLQGKRGIEKPPFKLPEFIEATGITEMRNAYQEKEEAKKLKQKQRDRMTAKTGKMDIAYEVLYDAFFKHQRKPKMSGLGELYYEGKEYEARLEHLRPGVLSAELREALGMPEDTPPPWLINMQRYGPPPSYPQLKVPGLSAPIPPGASFGFHPGGWGKPPVDAAGNALYGDVFGLAADGNESDAEVDKLARWGEIDDFEEEESSEEEEQEQEEEELPDEADIMQGIATDATGISSLQSGLETPDVALNLRKQGDSLAGTESAQNPQLYTVLEQRKASVGAGLLGTDHTYVIPGAEGGGKKKPGTDVEVTLSPEELEGLDDAAIKALYESKLAAAQAAAKGDREDFSDMVAGHAAAQKRKIQQRADTRAAKKQKDKDFKF